MIDSLLTILPRPGQRVALVFFVSVVAAAVLAPLFPYQVGIDVQPDATHLGPTLEHPLGTDRLGRDMFWRLVLSSQAFVAPGLLACWVASLCAIPLGAMAGYWGGAVERVVRYGFTVVASLPRFVLVLLICTIYGSDLTILALAAGLAYSPTLAEAVFARVEQLRSHEFLLANRAYGLPSYRIVWFHLVFAACGRLILRHLLALFAYFLVLESTLSYLGHLGVQEPTPSWGNILKGEWSYDWWSFTMVTPAIVIWLIVVSLTALQGAFSEVSADG